MAQSHRHSANALIHETSPYLQQHAYQPVDWFPWQESVLARAKAEDKPILLSIGYSACHWCHVMAHECFDDPEIAALMNAHFINIKVDREERPDLDKIYQLGHQMLTQRPGGWPLTVFLDPIDLYPFFAGTYFPPKPRHGLPAFNDLLLKIVDFYQQHRDQIKEQNYLVADAYRRLDRNSGSHEGVNLSTEPLNEARQQIGQNFDATHGGFTPAPKFPHLTHIERLFRHYYATKKPDSYDETALSMALFTLRKMAFGGLYDQLGGGFFRYSVDEEWLIPHFEKMLYDNGPFLCVYTEAWQIQADALFQRIVSETAQWVMREMQSPEGGYYSTLDADSEGVEGKFYVWDRQELQNLLDKDHFPLFATHFGIGKIPNFEEHWHLHIVLEAEFLTEKYKLDGDTVSTRLNHAKKLAFEKRQQRIFPGRDEKILTAWNGLMIKGMALAGQTFAQKEWLLSAQNALDFIRQTLWHNGRLLATYKDGKAHLNAYLDDYAFLLDAILTLLQARWRSEEMQFAIELAEVLLAQFEDKKRGGFFFTAHDHEALITRPRPFTDEATPSGNGVAAYALARLGHLLGETRYLQAAERTIKAAWLSINQFASAHGSLLLALEEDAIPPQLIVLRGKIESIQVWQQHCQTGFHPHRLCLAIPDSAQDLPGHLAEFTVQGDVVAYICQGFHCLPPVRDWAEFTRIVA
ncbi:thioredoxin domain-containing protein [Thioflexithrix psekupsensis]|uniref:Thioredoxin domain-containing protein n=1 Tax=Thioflexithrix psekupsensis TaxID=1570016 RepID=A0A251X4T3_9GAMM|nr:thioredoxin domain-containing protein [Thioflexithrix psekupsensis]OUD12390.1 thioredoxin domain-containing protein [Thioflexithrix psekupsensis]